MEETNMEEFEVWNDSRKGESPEPCKLKCIDCNGPAEGKFYCVDGDICNDCQLGSEEN